MAKNIFFVIVRCHCRTVGIQKKICPATAQNGVFMQPFSDLSHMTQTF